MGGGTTSEGTLEGGVYRFYLQEENMADLEAVLSAIFHKNVKLDLTMLIPDDSRPPIPVIVGHLS